MDIKYDYRGDYWGASGSNSGSVKLSKTTKLILLDSLLQERYALEVFDTDVNV